MEYDLIGFYRQVHWLGHHKRASLQRVAHGLHSPPQDGKQRTLTVHHLDMDPSNCNDYNLVALCQACPLRTQSRFDLHQICLVGTEPDYLDWSIEVMLNRC